MRLFIDFIPVEIWALLAVALVIIMLLASWVLRPHVLQNSEKTSTYECGEEPVGPARVAYPYSYIMFTILFVIVDVMSAFLYILSASTLRLDVFIVWQAVLFMAVIMAGVGYAMKKMPETTPDGKETLLLYQQAKAEQARAESNRRSHH